MYTANTMAALIETLGMTLPFSSTNPAKSDEKQREAASVGEYMKTLLALDIKPSDIMTREAFEDAITVVMALAVQPMLMHLIAMARTVGIDLTQDDFQKLFLTVHL